MKKYCLNYQSCGWVEYILPEEFDPKQERFFNCPECRSLAAVVNNEFSLNENINLKVQEQEDDSNEE